MKIFKQETNINYELEPLFYFGKGEQLEIYKKIENQLYKDLDQKHAMYNITCENLELTSDVWGLDKYERSRLVLSKATSEMIERGLSYKIKDILGDNYIVEWGSETDELGHNGDGDILITSKLTNKKYIVEVKSTQPVNNENKQLFIDDQYINISAYNNCCKIGKDPTKIISDIWDFNDNSVNVEYTNICKKIGIYIFWHGKYIDAIEIRPMPLFMSITKDNTFSLIAKKTGIKCSINSRWSNNPQENFNLIKEASKAYLKKLTK